MNGLSERTEANASQNAATDGGKFTGVGEQLGARATRSERPRRPTTQEQRLFGLFLQDAKAVPEEGPASALSLNQSPNL